MLLLSKAAWKDESFYPSSVFTLIRTNIIVLTKGKQELEGSRGWKPKRLCQYPPVTSRQPDPGRPPAQTQSTKDAAQDRVLLIHLSLSTIVGKKAIKEKPALG